MDKTKPAREQNLVEWARPYLTDTRKIARVIDPALDGQYSVRGAIKAAAVAYQCLSQNAKSRPQMSAVVEALEPLQDLTDESVAFVYDVEIAEKDGERSVNHKDNGTRHRGQRHKVYRRTSAIKELQCK